MFKAGQFVIYDGMLCEIMSVDENGWWLTLRLIETKKYLGVGARSCILATGLIKELF